MEQIFYYPNIVSYSRALYISMNGKILLVYKIRELKLDQVDEATFYKSFIYFFANCKHEVNDIISSDTSENK